MKAMEESFDVIVIGAGMSGLAAAIRLAMFDKKVCLLEQHAIAGGLNSYYRRGQRKLDVGLHAMTNYSDIGQRSSPLGKMLKQLRLPREALKLMPQNRSSIAFPSAQLRFDNHPELLMGEVFEHFPQQEEGFRSLWQAIELINIGDMKAPCASARAFVREFIKDPLLENMIFCPVLYYGSAWENDMDLQQFAVMFKSIFMEGFCRPEGGIRPLLKWLVDRYRELGGDLRYRTAVAEILHEDGRVLGVKTEKGDLLLAPVVLSSMGRPETEAATQTTSPKAKAGNMGFVETILMHETKPKDWGVEDTIVFWSGRDDFRYSCAEGFRDDESAVICFPNNFERDDQVEGICRVTRLASYDAWKNCTESQYSEEKKRVEDSARALLRQWAKAEVGRENFVDTFTPLTIERFTRHARGAIYGSPDKSRDGRTHLSGLELIGTDQGFLGIVGAMLSGISIANQKLL
jgi:phytoene dehydrogenase-like protein